MPRLFSVTVSVPDWVLRLPDGSVESLTFAELEALDPTAASSLEAFLDEDWALTLAELGGNGTDRRDDAMFSADHPACHYFRREDGLVARFWSHDNWSYGWDVRHDGEWDDGDCVEGWWESRP